MRRTSPHNATRANPARAAFTLIELLLVISILILLLAIGVPAFSSMLYSSSQSLSQNALRSGLSAARDLALRSDRGEDAAAVFFYEPGGRISIVPCRKVGEFVERVMEGESSGWVRRELFAPEPTVEVVQLPQGWTVRGYAPSNAFTGGWYSGTYDAPDTGHWVLPETGFFRADRPDQGRYRQTFMVRFEGATGTLLPPQGEHVRVLSPAPSAVFRTQGLWKDYRADLAADPARYVRRVLTALGDRDVGVLLGNTSSDTVLARAVGELAVMNERRLAAAIGVRVDRDTGTIYEGPSGNNWSPRFVPAAGSGGPIVDRVDRWVLRNGEALPPDEAEPYYASDARVFTIQRYLGTLQELALAEGN